MALNEDIEVIFEFLQTSEFIREEFRRNINSNTAYAEYINRALEALRTVGWTISVLKGLADGNTELRAYNRYKYTTQEERHRWAIRYVYVKETPSVMAAFVVSIIDAHIAQMKISSDDTNTLNAIKDIINGTA